MIRHSTRPALPALCVLVALSACAGPDSGIDDPFDVVVGPYEATIRRTAYGIPHIVADDAASLAYGTGYAFAEDHVCTLADQMVKVRSERARYFGRGAEDEHLNSDIAWKVIGVMQDAEARWFDLDEELRGALVGYTAGYNQYLADVGPAGLPAPCRNAEWVKPITHIDLLAFYLHLGQFGSGFNLIDFIATATPPGQNRRLPPPTLEDLQQAIRPDGGSNGLALGGDLTTSGRGMVVSNSHFEAEGERRWWELHQTIPGELDVYGVALTGVPLVNMGFNRDVAWTHTVSTTPRFIIYQLELDSTNPTRYRYDGAWRAMDEEIVSIEVLQEDGSLKTYEQTTYHTVYGPMLDAPIVGWTPSLGFTYQDINLGNTEMIPAWWGMNRATSLDELEAAQSRQGIPWVHTIAASREGEAYYADSAAAPNLTDDAFQAFLDLVDSDFLVRQFRNQGAWVMDGGDPGNRWVDEGTAIPYAVPAADYPRLRNQTFVTNSNENFWLANHEQPLTSYPPIYGEVDVPRQGRTKMGQRLLAGLDPDADPGPDGTFDAAELEAAILSYPAHHADVLKDPLVARCEAAGSVTVRHKGEDRVVDLTEACAVLDAWDGSLRVDARGAHLFREWIASGQFELGYLSTFVHAGDFDQKGKVFADDFDPSNPITTPSVLAEHNGEGPDPIVVALGKAVLTLEDVGVALDARLGDLQYREKFGERTPCPGGKELEGSLLIADWRTSNSTLLPREHTPRAEWHNEVSELTVDGEYPISGGDSWVSVLTWDEDGPSGRGVLVYSNSADPDSPHANDQAALHGSGQLRPILFDEADILADPELVEKTISLDEQD